MVKLKVELQVLYILFFSNYSIFVDDFLHHNCKSSPLLFVTLTMNKTDLAACYLATSCYKIQRLRFDNILNGDF